MNFKSAVKFLDSFISYEKKPVFDPKKDFDLKRMRRFLEVYGVDCSKVNFVHVAGSKGKGTVCRLMAKYLWRAGFHTGLYTSPHLVDVRERFWFDGGIISEKEFVRLVEDFKKFAGGNVAVSDGLTYFEILTGLALKWFAEKNADYAVIEVGLGGRVDATNVIMPKLAVITSVEMEHAGILGDTLEEILDHKLGIVKDGVPAVIGYQSREIVELTKKKLGKKNSVSFVQEMPGCFALAGHDEARIKNGRTAYVALKNILNEFDEDLFAEVFSGMKIDGHFDVRKIDGKTVILDVAHTVNSVSNLIMSLRKVFPGKKFVFLVALMKGKNVEGILEQISDVAEKIYFTDVNKERGIPAMELAHKIDGGMVLEDLKKVIENLGKDQVLVAMGSNYLVGSVLMTRIIPFLSC